MGVLVEAGEAAGVLVGSRLLVIEGVTKGVLVGVAVIGGVLGGVLVGVKLKPGLDAGVFDKEILCV